MEIWMATQMVLMEENTDGDMDGNTEGNMEENTDGDMDGNTEGNMEENMMEIWMATEY